MKIDTIPSKLAFYVVDSLDIKRKAIKTSNGYIQINEDSVTEIFGLKNEGQDIYEIVVPEERNEIKENWNKQFADDKKIRQRDIVNKIVESICVDTNFKLNFIVLFINSMISTTKMGLCITDFVSNVVPNFDYKNINWCKYIYDITMASKITWNRFSKTDFYTGPITFLTLIYVNSTKCTEYHHRRLKPAILEWTSEMLRKREKFEMENGGFGNLEMNTDDVEDTIISKGKKTAEEFISSINQDMDELVKIKAEIENNMTKSIMLYPNNQTLKDLKAVYEGMFKISQNMVLDVVQPQEERTEETIVANEEEEMRSEKEEDKNKNEEEIGIEKVVENEDLREEQSEKEEEKKEEEEKEKEKGLEEKVIQRMEEQEDVIMKSQDLIKSKEYQKTNIIEETPPSCPAFRVITELDTPRTLNIYKSKKDDLVFKIKAKDKQVAKDKEQLEEREKRTEKVGEYLKSPYLQRIVDVETRLHSIERKIAEWMFSLTGNYL